MLVNSLFKTLTLTKLLPFPQQYVKTSPSPQKTVANHFLKNNFPDYMNITAPHHLILLVKNLNH